jgi:C-terminal processing protease CtpA/Prc
VDDPRHLAAHLARALLLVVASACSGSVGSAGAVFARDNETLGLYVREVPKGLAADKAGLRPGDEILMIDGVLVRDLDVKQLRERLRGDVGSSMELTVVRGRDVRRVRVVRTEMTTREKPPPKEQRIDE